MNKQTGMLVATARRARWAVRLGAVVLLGVTGCVEVAPGEPPEAVPAPPEWGDVPVPPGAGSETSFEVVLDELQPGWLVTTSRLTAASAPTLTTQVSDGSPIALHGAADDLFAATVTDASGRLVAMHSMRSPCTMARSRQLRVPSEYPSIQAAVDAASPGDTVAVAAGTYTESVKLRAGVCLIGSGAHRTVLDARGEPRKLVDLTRAPGSVVAGFTMRGVTQPMGCASTDPFFCSGNWYGAAIYIGGTEWRDPTQDAPPQIVGNVFEDNDIGVLLYWRGVAVVRNNVFVGNRSGLVANHFQSRTLVANNVFVSNVELAIGNQAAYLDLLHNVIAGSQLGIRFQWIQTGYIRCNVFFGNGANANEPRFTIGTDGNLEVEPGFVDAGAGDFRLRPGSRAIDAGCRGGREPDGTRDDIGAYGGPLAGWVEL